MFAWPVHIRCAIVALPVLSHMRQGYSFVQIAELRRVFNNFDRDGNCMMSRSELARAVQQLFPGLAHTIEFRPVLTDLFCKVDEESRVSKTEPARPA